MTPRRHEDYGLFASDEDNIRLALAPQDIQNTQGLPMAGWPPYQDLFRHDWMTRRKLPDWGVRALGQSMIARQAGISFPGPWEQRSLHVWRRRNGS